MKLFEIIKDRDFSIYGTSDFIRRIIEDYEIKLSDEGYSIEILDEEDYVILSRCVCGNEGEIWIIEELFNELGKQIYSETDIAIIQGDILDMVDLDEIITEEIIVISKDVEETPEVVEEILDEVLEELEHGQECPHCIIKQGLLTSYNIGRKDGLIDAMDRIKELL